MSLGFFTFVTQLSTLGAVAWKDKSGVDPEEAVQLVQFVRDRCPRLQLLGLMTIGAYGFDVRTGPNPDFQRLIACRDRVCVALSLQPLDLELSMGMSADFEHAVSCRLCFLGKFCKLFLSSRRHLERQHGSLAGPG